MTIDRLTFLPGTDTPAPELMTIEEAARYLRLDEGGRHIHDAVASVTELVKKKRLRPTKISRRNLFWREELDRLIRDSTYPPQRAESNGHGREHTEPEVMEGRSK